MSEKKEAPNKDLMERAHKNPELFHKNKDPYMKPASTQTGEMDDVEQPNPGTAQASDHHEDSQQAGSTNNPQLTPAANIGQQTSSVNNPQLSTYAAEIGQQAGSLNNPHRSSIAEGSEPGPVQSCYGGSNDRTEAHSPELQPAEPSSLQHGHTEAQEETQTAHAELEEHPQTDTNNEETHPASAPTEAQNHPNMSHMGIGNQQEAAAWSPSPPGRPGCLGVERDPGARSPPKEFTYNPEEHARALSNPTVTNDSSADERSVSRRGMPNISRTSTYGIASLGSSRDAPFIPHVRRNPPPIKPKCKVMTVKSPTGQEEQAEGSMATGLPYLDWSSVQISRSSSMQQQRPGGNSHNLQSSTMGKSDARRYLDFNPPETSDARRYLDVNPPETSDARRYLDVNPPETSDARRHLDVNPPGTSDARRHLDVNPSETSDTRRHLDVSPPETSDAKRYLDFKRILSSHARRYLDFNQPEGSDATRHLDFNQPETSDARRHLDFNQPETSDARRYLDFNQPDTSDARRHLDFNQPEASDARRYLDFNQPETSDARRHLDCNQPEISDDRRRPFFPKILKPKASKPSTLTCGSELSLNLNLNTGLSSNAHMQSLQITPSDETDVSMHSNMEEEETKSGKSQVKLIQVPGRISKFERRSRSPKPAGNESNPCSSENTESVSEPGSHCENIDSDNNELGREILKTVALCSESENQSTGKSDEKLELEAPHSKSGGSEASHALSAQASDDGDGQILSSNSASTGSHQEGDSSSRKTDSQDLNPRKRKPSSQDGGASSSKTVSQDSNPRKRKPSSQDGGASSSKTNSQDSNPRKRKPSPQKCHSDKSNEKI